MAIITGYTAEKMNQFNNASVISGSVNTAGNLVLKTRGGTNIDAGNVKGPVGATGPVGITGGPTSARDAAFPLPTTVAASVALANKVPTWFNTNTARIETYYAKTGSSGLAVPGVSGNYGWYENKHLSLFPKGRIIETYSSVKTPHIDTNSATPWVVSDSLVVPLVAGRQYRMQYKFASVAASANMAVSLECHTSAVSDVKPSSGTLIDTPATIYMAPVVFQGKTHIMEFQWTAAATGSFLLKISTSRATTTGYFYFEKRRCTIWDEGMPAPDLIFTPF